ncbi:MAG: hypothetical protein DHS20C19_30200 [Acidimicrobiales bacterium]|nr:MAG: hypothetical protein DHS20C19_30200 [Acidimicrobiales bacterium]
MSLMTKRSDPDGTAPGGAASTCFGIAGAGWRRLACACVLVACVGAVTPPAAAQSGGAGSAEEAARIVKRDTGARVLGVRQMGGRYLVKIMTGDGGVRVVAVPAR